MATKRKTPKPQHPEKFVSLPSVHYVVAAYLGPRRIEDPVQEKDRLHYLREHMVSLAQVKHELDHVTVMIATDNEVIDRDRWSRLVAGVVPAKIRRHAVDVRWHPNSVGLSYASLVAAASTDYDYTIFTEDDYVFAVDHFDRYLVAELEAKKASWVCGAAWPHPEMPVHAAVASGIFHSKHLVGLTVAEYPQLVMSRAMLPHGPIVDWLADYATAFKQDSGELRWIGDKQQAMLVPVQLIDKAVTRDGHRIKGDRPAA
jgi:hypothetical protein